MSTETDRAALVERLKQQSAVDEEAARRVAHIIGPASASARALEALDRRRAAGEEAFIINENGLWTVGVLPSVAARQAGDKEG